MADSKKPKVPRIRKKPSFREQADQTRLNADKPKRLRQTAGRIRRPLQVVAGGGRKEYYLPLPDTKVGRFLNKRRGLMPKYFRESWAELRQVTWPSRKETWKLTFAVFMFAIIFGVIIAVVDFGLDKLFKKVLLKI